MTTTATAPRKGATRMADIPPEVLAGLNAGRRETATLAESLAIDFTALLAAAVPEAAGAVPFGPKEGVTRRMAAAGGAAVERLGPGAVERLAAHPSDTVRGWACYALAAAPGLTLAERLERVRPLADDPHFGVREWAWLALRPHIAAAIDEALALLTPWTAEPSERLRRFASEATRPRGVWCSHIGALKTDPARGLPVLDPLRADGARYVQDSVANWLNDAAKSQPGWVQALCARWETDSPDPDATRRIVRRALRSVKEPA
ncbi:HEAT repeat domain-containing protein [Azospirillum argentinense]|uniref:HEAT repeat domain-containing protein n=1 Tax=Azospirillum argentinense TaxID=2970906 RepID=A0A5B0L4X7_9PROT|nr:HEAT repeat domain-containing protein [Azospirillum argentinense]KAA1058334.1 DNA alkylation repair enzyme [Azospirillum argentinense]